MKILPSLILSFILVGLWSCSDSGNLVDSGSDTSDPVVDDCGVTDGDNSSCVNYYTEIQPIFNSKCTVCHGSSGGGLSLASWDDLMTGNSTHGPVVISGDTVNSKLLEKIMPNPSFGDRMPQSNQSYFADNPTELQLIKTWIFEGAKNN